MKRLFYSAVIALSVLSLVSFLGPIDGIRKSDPVNSMMVSIPGGSFVMGDAHGEYDEITLHKVTLAPFKLSKTEITQAQWITVMGSNPSYDQTNLNQPVTDVNWNDCQLFIAKLNARTGRKYRLPTEAEWEFAARGGLQSKGYIYAGSDIADSVAWHSEFDAEKPHVVASKQPNELGLYDMSGNVWEWCSDWYGPYSNKSQNNPEGQTKGDSKVIRGGSWGSSAEYCRATLRFRRSPQNRTYYYGIRLAE